jgi:two-component system sensor histidine kinase/response regulator
MPEEILIKPNILYVDDLKTNLTLFKTTFEKYYQIFLAESAAKALEILQKEKIQVLITDQRMPGMSGTELLQVVEKDYPEIIRFLLTAYTDFETVVEAVNKGHIHGYINKPLETDEVTKSINNTLEVYYLREKNKLILSDLERAHQELSELDTIKTGILKIMTREIRTPLNRIMGTIHLLKDKIESEELIQVINVLDTSVSRLEQFSSMAEQISALKSRERKLKLEEISIKQLIDYGLVETSEMIREMGIKVDVSHSQELKIQADFELLISCFVSIMDHAIQHTGPSETISIIADRMDDKTVVDIVNSGKNYTEKRLDDLTKHFNKPTRQLDLDFGIELALAQLIMELHNGDIGFFVKGQDAVTMRLTFGGP